MEELTSIAQRIVTVRFEFDRNGHQMLANAYEVLLADQRPPRSVQSGPPDQPTQQQLQEVTQ